MGNKHLKRLATSKTWNIKKKGIKYIMRPNSGMHSFKLGTSLNVVFRDLLKLAKTSKEVKKILNNQEVLVDGKRRKDSAFMIGFMDVLSIPKIKENYRILMSKDGKLIPVKIDEKEAQFKLCRIKNKTPLKKQIQLNLSGSRNILVEKTENKTGDTLVVELPSQKIRESLKFEKGAIIYLFAGKHAGYVGKIQDMKENKIIFKTEEGENIETLKKYAFVIGKEKPIIKISEK